MTDISPLQRDLGTYQGRIQPSGTVPPEGAYVMVLGHDLPSHTEILAINDYIEVAQSAVFTAGTKIFRFKAHLRSPVFIPVGLKWIVTLSIDGVERARRTLRAKAVLDVELASNVSNMSAGAHIVAMRLQLVTG